MDYPEILSPEGCFKHGTTRMVCLKGREISTDKPHCFCILLLGRLQTAQTYEEWISCSLIVFSTSIAPPHNYNGTNNQYCLQLTSPRYLIPQIFAQPYLFLSSPASSHPLSLHLPVKSNDHFDPASVLTSIFCARHCFFFLPPFVYR